MEYDLYKIASILSKCYHMEAKTEWLLYHKHNFQIIVLNEKFSISNKIS